MSEVEVSAAVVDLMLALEAFGLRQVEVAQLTEAVGSEVVKAGLRESELKAVV